MALKLKFGHFKNSSWELSSLPYKFVVCYPLAINCIKSFYAQVFVICNQDWSTDVSSLGLYTETRFVLSLSWNCNRVIYLLMLCVSLLWHDVLPSSTRRHRLSKWQEKLLAIFSNLFLYNFVRSFSTLIAHTVYLPNFPVTIKPMG